MENKQKNQGMKLRRVDRFSPATLARQHCRRAAGSARPRLRCLGTSSSPDSSRGSLSANLISARARASLSGQLETGEPTLGGSQSKQSVWLWLQDTPESFRLRDDTSKQNAHDGTFRGKKKRPKAETRCTNQLN